MSEVDAVVSVNDPDDIGDRVVRYRDVRCPDCNRMFFCLQWEDYGYPSVHCPPCGNYYRWPFDEIDGLEHRYRNNEWPVGESND